jgi:hypothetical protein
VFLSSDGIAGPGLDGVTYVQQDPTAWLCHNPGWIAGDPRGWITSLSNLTLTYGVSLAPFGQAEYQTRQMAYTTVSLLPQ